MKSNPPERVVSLVPSLTESLFDLGYGSTVVGITDYCIYPEEELEGLPRLGGPKNPRVSEIIALQPDLVLANREENTRLTVSQLENAGIRVWVSFPTTAQEALEVLHGLVDIFHPLPPQVDLRTLEQALAWAEASSGESVRTFCPIWEDETSAGVRWWMTFNRRTYPHDVLRLAGGSNLFADRERLYPLEADLGLAEPLSSAGRDTRYPRVTLEEIQRLDPEVILLPSEPYSFTEEHIEEFCRLLPESSAVREGRVYLVDGSLLTWHGTRLGRALRELPELFQ